MEKLKSILLALLAAVMIVSPIMGSKNVNAAEKVKVYIFEAGGCPYCEQEIEYLKGLDSYNKKFVIVEKELYVDHVDWAEGKDYKLGKLVADAFQQAGFTDASYEGTPFVVISDIYAATTYTESLSDYIEKAYKDGDKDVVGCYEKGGKDCLEGVTVTPVDTTGSSDNTDDGSGVIKVIVLIMIVGGIVALAVLGRSKVMSDDFEEEDYEDDYENEEEEEPVKKVTAKKEAVKEEKKTVKKTKTTTKKVEPKEEKKTTKAKTTTRKKNNK